MNYTEEEQMILDYVRTKGLYFDFNDIGKDGSLNFCLERLPLDIGGKEFFFYLTVRPPFVEEHIGSLSIWDWPFDLAAVQELKKDGYVEIIIDKFEGDCD
ncbi:hypothetical protein UFOVP1361_21 [uncultured Caudovirales phage]|uniref:Uncharacterized protein n=1 Tax=uncultured Caudovirales phage TaxID=2100421 RepID=A0A6J5RUD6_9CAUD|nr:hypothetical protein UFOVP1361_21 [uncultured Caudovirales phage]